jgi:uncharacterized membrane protein
MEKMKNKLLFVLAIVFLATIAVFTSVITSVKADTWQLTSQPDINSMKVYVKGELVFSGNCSFTGNTSDTEDIWTCETHDQLHMPSLERGETIDVKVVFEGGSNATIGNAIVRAWFRASGTTVEDETREFDIYNGNTYTKTLYLKLPTTLDVTSPAPRFYTFHVDIEAERTLSGIHEASVDFDTQRLSNELQIKSLNVRTACGTSCNTVYTDIVVKNTGNHDMEDIYVKATIKELGISGSAFIDLLVPYRNGNDEDISKEVSIALNLPANVRAGTYTLEVKAYNDESEDTETQQFTISGLEGSAIEVVAQTTRQDVEKGKSTVYTLLVTNRGTATQTFTVEASGLEGWASSQINPASFSLAGGESKLVSMYVATNEDAVAAEHLFSVKVRYGQELKTFNFIANVTETKTNVDLKTSLMIVGIVLAVAIVILLIVLLTQRRGEAGKPEESYY